MYKTELVGLANGLHLGRAIKLLLTSYRIYSGIILASAAP